MAALWVHSILKCTQNDLAEIIATSSASCSAFSGTWSSHGDAARQPSRGSRLVARLARDRRDDLGGGGSDGGSGRRRGGCSSPAARADLHVGPTFTVVVEEFLLQRSLNVLLQRSLNLRGSNLVLRDSHESVRLVAVSLLQIVVLARILLGSHREVVPSLACSPNRAGRRYRRRGLASAGGRHSCAHRNACARGARAPIAVRPKTK